MNTKYHQGAAFRCCAHCGKPREQHDFSTGGVCPAQRQQLANRYCCTSCRMEWTRESLCNIDDECPRCGIVSSRAPYVTRPEDAADHHFLFDVKFFASIRVTGKDRVSAEAILREKLNGAEVNFGSWGDGTSIVATVDIEGAVDLLEVDMTAAQD